MHINSQLATLFGQIMPWVQTTLEAFELSVEDRIMSDMEKFNRELHECINSFEKETRAQLCEA